MVDSVANWIAKRPIAHRGLHDIDAGRPENTLAAARAAVESNYAIEIDLHPSSDGVPMVFHDQLLQRMTGESGRIRERTASELDEVRIADTDQTIPTLEQLLDLVKGRVGLVIELKGVAGKDEGFADAVNDLLAPYDGPAAVMSFNHWLLQDLKAAQTRLPIGLTAEGVGAVEAAHREIDREIGFDFLSYNCRDLPCPFAAEFHSSGRPVICWTVRTPEEAIAARLHADQITFEGFLP